MRKSVRHEIVRPGSSKAVARDCDGTAYPNLTVATRAARSASRHRVPYRIWLCEQCQSWHAEAWTAEHGPSAITTKSSEDTT